jgi:hypothetical protein
MERRDGPSGLMVVAGCLGILSTAAWSIQALPFEVTAALTAWAVASFPIGIVIGNCVLNRN